MIRPYAPKDRHRLLKVWYDAARIAHAFWPDERFAQERASIETEFLPHSETWVFEKGGEVVGFISLIEDEVGGLFVSPECQGQGIGRALIDHAGASRDRLELEVFAANSIGRGFYDAYGFERIGTRREEGTEQTIFRLRFDIRRHHRLVFDTIASSYDRHRPGYPAEAFALLRDWTGLTAGARCLEVGCGTGKASVPLAEWGLRLTAIEVGEEMAAIARQRLRPFPNAEVHLCAFEEFGAEGRGSPEGPGDSFDLIVGASSLQWIDPGTRAGQCHRLLPAGGFVGVLGHDYEQATEEITPDLWHLFDRYVPEWPLDQRRFRMPGFAKQVTAQMRNDPRFELLHLDAVSWSATYTADGYIELLDTFAAHRRIPAARRDPLYEGIRELIEAQPGGTVTRSWTTDVGVLRRL